MFGSHGSEGGFPPSIKYIWLLLLPAFTAFRKSLGRLEPELGESGLSRTCFHWFSSQRWWDWRVETRAGRAEQNISQWWSASWQAPGTSGHLFWGGSDHWALEARLETERTMMVPAHQLCRRPVYSLWRKRNKLTLKMIMTPWEDLFFVINNLLLGEEPVSPSQLLISKSFKWHFSVDWRFHPSGRNQRGLRSIHTLVLLSHWTKGQPGRFWALVNTGREVPLVSRYLDR